MRRATLLAILFCCAASAVANPPIVANPKVVANPHPVVAKLEQVADLTNSEMVQVLTLYLELRNELGEILPRPAGRKTIEHRNLIRNAYRKHRQATLKYLRPNQYRRWMVVANRRLPELQKDPLYLWPLGINFQ